MGTLFFFAMFLAVAWYMLGTEKMLAGASAVGRFLAYDPVATGVFFALLIVPFFIWANHVDVWQTQAWLLALTVYAGVWVWSFFRGVPLLLGTGKRIKAAKRAYAETGETETETPHNVAPGGAISEQDEPQYGPVSSSETSSETPPEPSRADKLRAAWREFGKEERAQEGGANVTFAAEDDTAQGDDIGNRLTKLRGDLEDAVVGQEDGKRALMDAMARAWAGIKSRKGPVAALIFFGPTGVGKTEMAESLARALAWPVKFFPCAQVGATGTLAWKLFGPEPGYSGSQKGGELTQFLRGNPESVVVFDEFEKPLKDDPTVFQSLLNLLSEGRIKDNSLGDTYDASRCIVIFTSNLLASEKLDGLDARQLKDALASRGGLPPEFMGRIHAAIPFSPLAAAQIEQIARRIVGRTIAAFASANRLTLDVKIGSGVVAEIVKKTDQKYGVRDLQGVIDDALGSAIAEVWIERAGRPARTLNVYLLEGRITARMED